VVDTAHHGLSVQIEHHSKLDRARYPDFTLSYKVLYKNITVEIRQTHGVK